MGVVLDDIDVSYTGLANSELAGGIRLAPDGNRSEIGRSQLPHALNSRGRAQGLQFVLLYSATTTILLVEGDSTAREASGRTV